MFFLKITFSSYQPIQFNVLSPFKYKKDSYLKKKIKQILSIQKNKKFNIMKSTFVNKKSKEQFQYRVYKNSYQITSHSIRLLFNIMLYFKKKFKWQINFQLKYCPFKKKKNICL